MSLMKEEIRSTSKLITKPGAVIEAYTFEIPKRIQKEMMLLRYGTDAEWMPIDLDLIDRSIDRPPEV